MQNRNMFLYRRQGPKKRPKSGTSRKSRSPQKGLPTSARDLLPIIQPATKALAQMLAGRSAASGQLGHARAVLAQTERLVAERAHNRLNPVEREEFFEQVARLKLTLSDADSEAEFQAAEEQSPSPPPVSVDRERLKAMALSLTSSSKDTAREDQPSEDQRDASETRPNAVRQESDDDLHSETAEAPTTAAQQPKGKPKDASPEAADVVAGKDRSTVRADGTQQLRLPREAAEELGRQSEGRSQLAPRRQRKNGAVARTKTAAKRSATPTKTDDAEGNAEVSNAEPAEGRQKLPKGWIIDDEGYVVPGPR